jgi:hypothetical protein
MPSRDTTQVPHPRMQHPTAELKLESSMPHLSMRRSISSDGAVGTDRLRHLEQAALRHGVPVEEPSQYSEPRPHYPGES